MRDERASSISPHRKNTQKDRKEGTEKRGKKKGKRRKEEEKKEESKEEIREMGISNEIITSVSSETPTIAIIYPDVADLSHSLLPIFRGQI
jgi:ribosomal protein S25